MSIDKISGNLQGIEALLPRQNPKTEGIETPEKKGGTFGELLTNSISDLNNMQLKADEKITDLMLGNGKVTAHEAMIALEKADIAFQLMNQVRTKIVQAYQEVLRTQI